MTESNTWKAIAIVFIILLILENVLFVWGYISMANEDEKISECYYNVCQDYPDADYNLDLKLCNCYDKDLLDNPVLVKQIYMGK